MESFTEGLINLRYQSELVGEPRLLAWVHGFRQIYPKLQFVISPGDALSIEADLIADRIQIGILSQVQSSEFVVTAHAGNVTMKAVAGPSWLGNLQRPILGANELLQHPRIDCGSDHPALRSWLGSARHDLINQSIRSPSLIVPSSNAALHAAQLGMGIAFVPAVDAAPAVATSGLAVLLDSESAPPLPLLFAYRKKNSRSLGESVLIEYLLERTLC